MNFANCLKRYITRYDDDKKITKNIANFGLLPFETAKVMRNGEYFGVEIQAIDHILPLFTTHMIDKTYTYLQKNDYQNIVQLLKIQKEYTKYGNDVVHYIIKKWCDHVHVDIPKDIKDVNIDDKILDGRIKLNRSDEIIGKFKIISIGTNVHNNTSVLPEEWMGREFNSAKELHLEMNKLPYRKGTPPVTYCCTYGMIITTDKETKQWIQLKKFNDELNSIGSTFEIDFAIILDKINTNVKAQIINKENYEKLDIDKYRNYKLIFTPKSTKHVKIVIIIHPDIFVTDKQLITKNNTSYLSSLLQKCYRHQHASDLLEETINKLHYSAGYNLPDQHFARVSGCRQLLWRSYISIVEDISPYQFNNDNIKTDLLDLFVLAFITQIDPNVLLNDKILNTLKNDMLCVQNIDKTWNWRKGKDVFSNEKYNDIIKNIKVSDLCKHRIENAFLLALVLMPMMRNDFIMLSKAYDFVQLYELPNIPTSKSKENTNDDIYDNCLKMTGLDMHCMPMILIQLQGSIPFLPTDKYTLPNLSKFIWENSSGLNSRYCPIPKSINSSDDLLVLQTLHRIQELSLNNDNDCDHLWLKYDQNIVDDKYSINLTTQKEYIKRLAFLLIFGKKYKLNKKMSGKQYDIIVCGNVLKPCRVKKTVDKNKMEYIEDNNRYLAEKEFCNEFSEIVSFKNIIAPTGYKWSDELLGSNQKLSVKIEKDIPNEFRHKLAFYVGNIKLQPFDAGNLIEPIKSTNIFDLPDELEDILNIMFYNEYDNVFENILELFKIAQIRRKNNDNRVFDWIKLVNDFMKEPMMYVRSRLIMGKDDVTIGPVDRSGNKTQNSISYIYEGVIWRMMVTFSALYPNVIHNMSPYKFRINMNTFGYSHLINCLNKFCDKKQINKFVQKNKKITEPKLVTKLWEHQEKSINKITHEMFINNRKGFGDASDVGAGKTLTALGIVIKILDNLQKIKDNTHSGFLVLLPTEKLFDTWKTEIKKHTVGLHVIEQYSNGKLNDDISINSVVITTMGRCRDKPIIHPWLLTIIDECLTVQNKEALQTEEAWRQSSYSKYGVLMLSATFFRSRFEKMLYMLSMLDTGLPEESNYLDTILSESIVCNLGEKQRKWLTNINEILLSKEKQNEYDKISARHSEIGFEKVYHMLDNFIRTNVDYIKIFEDSIDKIVKTRPTSKILIYANSKTEADKICKLKNVGRYPDITKTHVVVSYSEGTYGLNNLVIFDTILSRPPEPDKLPQMKGRLDRPGQKCDLLYLEYVLIKNTIEDMSLYKLEIASNFYGHHILPLAEYYKLAVIGNK